MEPITDKRFVVLICVTLALVTFVAFEQVRSFEFVIYDDADYVTENPPVKAGLTHRSVIWAFTTNHSSNWHPLTWISHMLDCHLFGLKAGMHHLTNLFIHIANTLLLFWVLKVMTGALWQSGFVAAMFALHPLHVESVAWVSERKDVLSVFFWLLTMAAYVRYVKRPDVRGYLFVVLFFALGLLAKPMLVTLPFALLLLDYWPLGRFQSGKDMDRLVREKIPLFALAVVSCMITFAVQQRAGVMEFGKGIPLNFRVLNGLVAYISYIAKMVYPSGLAVLYPHPGESLQMWQPIISLLIFAGVSAGIIYSAQRHRFLLVGWLWYIGTLVPVIGLVQVGPQAMADRYTYLPSVGIFIIAAWGAAEILAKWRYKQKALAVTAVVVLAAMLICTRLQLRYWQNSVTLCERAISINEKNPLMHNNLGVALMSWGELDKAATHLSRAVQIVPDYENAYYNLGNVFHLQDNFDEAIVQYRRALELNPEDTDAHNNIGTALQLQGRVNEAIVHYRQAVKLRPKDTRLRKLIAIEQGIPGIFDHETLVSEQWLLSHALDINQREIDSQKIEIKKGERSIILSNVIKSKDRKYLLRNLQSGQ